MVNNRSNISKSADSPSHIDIYFLLSLSFLPSSSSSSSHASFPRPPSFTLFLYIFYPKNQSIRPMRKIVKSAKVVYYNLPPTFQSSTSPMVSDRPLASHGLIHENKIINVPTTILPKFIVSINHLAKIL